ncbi:hypothetical protein FB451DRAFT_1465349, partial [Mycena latifolia]
PARPGSGSPCKCPNGRCTRAHPPPCDDSVRHPPEVMQAMCTPMHQILPPSRSPSSASPYAPYTAASSSQHGAQLMSGGLFLDSPSAVNDPLLLRAHRVTHLVQALEAPGPRAPLAREEDVARAAPRGGRARALQAVQGVSRSSSVVIAFVKRKPACAKPNPSFTRALIEWEHSPLRRAAPLHLVAGPPRPSSSVEF